MIKWKNQSTVVLIVWSQQTQHEDSLWSHSAVADTRTYQIVSDKHKSLVSLSPCSPQTPQGKRADVLSVCLSDDIYSTSQSSCCQKQWTRLLGELFRRCIYSRQILGERWQWEQNVKEEPDFTHQLLQWANVDVSKIQLAGQLWPIFLVEY